MLLDDAKTLVKIADNDIGEGKKYKTQDAAGILQGTDYITTRDQKKAFRMCAEAAWRLGRWDDLEKYSSELVHGQGSLQSTAAITSPNGGVGA